MKKSIAMIMCVLTISLFLMQYSLVSHDNFEEVVYSEKKLGEDYTIQLPHSILSNDFDKIVQTLEENCHQYNASFFITKSQNNQYTKYICGENIKEYQDMLGVQSIYKASTEARKPNKIDKFDNKYKLTIKPLSDLKKDGYQLEGEAIVALKDAKQYEAFKLKLNTDLSIEIQEVSSPTGEVDMMSWMILSIFAFYLIFILLITYDIFQKYNQFAIYKLNGYSVFTIWKDYVLSIGICQLIASVPLFILLTLLVCQRCNAYVLEFLKQGLFMIMVVILLSVFLSTVIILHFAKVKIIDYLKNKNVSKAFMIFNQFILFCVVSIVVVLTSVGIQKGYAILSRYHNYNEWQQTKDYYIIENLVNVESQELFMNQEYLNNQKELYQKLNTMGSIFADFNEYDSETRDETSMAYVNINYLNQQHIQNIQNKDIQISENETQRIVLVPENTSFSKQDIINMTEGMYDISKGIKIIYYKDNQKFFTYNSQITENYTNMITHPIVQVLTNNNGVGTDYDRILAYKYSPYKIKASPKEINDILSQYHLSQYVEKYITAYDEMSMLNHNEMIIFMAVTIVLMTLIVLVVLIFVQNIQIYIHHHTKLLAVQTMNGYRLIDKYKGLVFLSVFTLFLSCVVSLVLGYPIDYLFVMYFMIYLFFGLIFISQTKKQERKSIILMLKGCE